MTHTELVEFAAKYAMSSSGLGCSVAITEARLQGFVQHGQRPDVLAWRQSPNCGTVKIECKATREDSIAEACKPHSMGKCLDIGNQAFILCPVGVQVVVPDDYGHLETDGTLVWQVSEATYRRNIDYRLERNLFAAMLAASGATQKPSRAARAKCDQSDVLKVLTRLEPCRTSDVAKELGITTDRAMKLLAKVAKQDEPGGYWRTI